MDAYATIDELRQRIGASVFDEIYGEDFTPGRGGLAIAAADLEAAAAEIDGAIALRYRLPVTGTRTLALLNDWCLTLAEERAFARPAGAAYTEKVKSRVEQVRKYLDMIRAETFRLPDAAENGSSGAAGIALVKASKPVFDRDDMEGF